MLKNAPTLAIGGADPAENEPPKVRQVSNKIRRNIASNGTAGSMRWIPDLNGIKLQDNRAAPLTAASCGKVVSAERARVDMKT